VQSEARVTWTGIGSAGKRRTIEDTFRGLLESIVTSLEAEMVVADAPNSRGTGLSRRLPSLERPVHFGRKQGWPPSDGRSANMTESHRTHPAAVICTAIGPASPRTSLGRYPCPSPSRSSASQSVGRCKRLLQARLPKLAATAITLLATVVAVLLIASLLTWGFPRVGQWMQS
jgi:hypothetical protein